MPLNYISWHHTPPAAATGSDDCLPENLAVAYESFCSYSSAGEEMYVFYLAFQIQCIGLICCQWLSSFFGHCPAQLKNQMFLLLEGILNPTQKIQVFICSSPGFCFSCYFASQKVWHFLIPFKPLPADITSSWEEASVFLSQDLSKPNNITPCSWALQLLNLMVNDEYHIFWIESMAHSSLGLWAESYLSSCSYSES